MEEKLHLLTSSPRTSSDEREPASTLVSLQMRTAKLAAKKLFDFLPPLDVGNPERFIAAVVSILAKYPAAVMLAAVDPIDGIPSRTDRPTLHLIKKVCEEYYEPIEHALWRERVQQEAVPLPPRRQRTPAEQAVVEEKVAAMRRQLGIPADGLSRRGAQASPPFGNGLPRGGEQAPRPTTWDRPFGERLLADLEARKARNQAQEPSEERSDDGNA